MATGRSVSDWKVWGLIWGLGAIATVAVTPYLIGLLGVPLRQAAAKAGVSLGVLLAAQIVQGIVLLAIAARTGIWAARRTGFAFPVFDALVSRGPLPRLGTAALVAIVSGFAIGALDVVLDVFVFAPGAALSLAGNQLAAWKGFLASFYGGITEEIFFRLFLLSLLALGLRRAMLGPGAERLPGALFWTANILVAVLFGLGHLPATAALAPLTPVLVVRAIVLNGVPAILFGALYRRHGLEIAILAHFSVDIALHVVPPLVG